MTQYHFETEHGGFRIPDPQALRTQTDLDGGIDIPVLARVADGDQRVDLSGVVRVSSHEAPADVDGLTCECGEPGCRHARIAAATVHDRLVQADALPAQRRAMTAVLADLAAEHASSVRDQEASRAATDSPSASYADNHELFQADYDAARARAAAGEPIVPLQLENATGGLGARDGGRAFGVELEFDLSNTDYRSHSAALDAIARDLHTAGLTPEPRRFGYHASENAGYTDARNAWRLEHDATVAGEVVSPILYDTPQTWQDLQTVCDIVRRHGGVATARTGGHVHVAAGNYDHTVENHNRLLGLVDSHQDTLFRLAANPERGRHRGTSWCAPNSVPADGYSSLGGVRRGNYGHHLALNLQSMNGEDSDHVEFRMWDASLDPGVIQAQVNLSLGITEAAFRGATTGSTAGRRDVVGDHHRRFGGRGRGARLSGDEWRESTSSFRSLVDTIFQGAQNRAQATALFAATRWQRR